MSRTKEDPPEKRANDKPAVRDFAADSSTRPRRAASIRAFPLGELEVLLFTADRQVVHTLNASAWAVWELCDGSRSVAQIAQELSGDVGRTADQLLPDVLATVRQLGSLALLDAG